MATSKTCKKYVKVICQQLESQKVKSDTCQRCLWQECRDHIEECPDSSIDFDSSHYKDGVYIDQMNGGVINIYHLDNSFVDRDLWYDHETCCCRHVTRENVSKEKWKTKLKRNVKSFRKKILKCVRDRDSTTTPSSEPVQTTDEINRSKIPVATSLSNGHSEKNSLLKQCTVCGSERNDSPVLTSLTGASKKIEIYGHRDSETVSGETNHSKESTEGFKNQRNVESKRQCCAQSSPHGNNKVTQNQNGRNCNVFGNECNTQIFFSDQSENNVNSGDHQTLMKTKEVKNDNLARMDEEISNHCDNSQSSSQNKKKEQCNVFSTEPVLNSEIDVCDLLKGQEEDTMRKQIPSNSNLSEYGTQTLTYFKLAHPDNKHEETETNDCTSSTFTYTDSSTSEPEPSSRYPFFTSSASYVGQFLLPTDSTEDSGSSLNISQCSKEENVPSISHPRKQENEFEQTVIDITCENNTGVEKTNEARNQIASVTGNVEGLTSSAFWSDMQGAIVHDQNKDTNDNNIKACSRNGFDASVNKSGCSGPVDDNSKELADGDKFNDPVEAKSERTTWNDTEVAALNKGNHTERRRNASVVCNITESAGELQSVPAFLSIGNCKTRKRSTSECSDSDYDTRKDSCIYERKHDVYSVQEFDCQTESCSKGTESDNEITNNGATDESIDGVQLSSNIDNLKNDECTMNKLSTFRLKKKSSGHFSSKIEFISINSCNCPSMLAVLLNWSNENTTSCIRISDEGILQEVIIPLEFQPDEINRWTEDQRQGRFEDERKKYKSKGHGAWDSGKHIEKSITLEDENVSRKRSFSDTLCYEFPVTRVMSKLDAETDMLDVVKEFHSIPNIATYFLMLTDRKGSHTSRSLSVSNVSDINRSTVHGFAPVTYIRKAHDSDQSKIHNYTETKTAALVSESVKSPVSTLIQYSRKCNDSVGPGQTHKPLSKSVTSIIFRNKGKRKKLTRHRKRRKVPKPVNKSSYVHQSTDLVSFDHLLRSTKMKHNHGTIGSTASLTRDQDKHEWPRKPRGECSRHCVDSGIGFSARSSKSSTQYATGNVSAPFRIQLKTGQMDNEGAERKQLPYLKKIKSVSQKPKRLFRQFFDKGRRNFVKSIVREIHDMTRASWQIYGLNSYFDRVFNGTPLSEQERMQYEWLRLASFQNYTGNGNALALARNGFYHDHAVGPSSTRCYLCNARHSNWDILDDVNAEHRRQSPNCPFHTNSGQASQNISIASADNSGASLSTTALEVTSTASNNTTTTVTNSNIIEASGTESTRRMDRPQISAEHASIRGGESISQQPTEDPESRDRSLLALSQPRTQRALGRTGNSYSTIVAPRKNNVATGARSNVGIDQTGNSSSIYGSSSQPPGSRLPSILSGPVGAGAFSGLRISTQTPTSTASEDLQRVSAESAASTQTHQGQGDRRGDDPTRTVVINNPKHSEYLNIDARINSYVAWPDYLDQTPRQMSEAGFFFVGVADFTRCFCCGGGLRNWEPGDDPMLEHTRWFPRCEYVNKLKGERYVAAVQRRHQEHMAEQQRQQIELAQRRDENRNPQDPMTTDAAAVMREMGYSVDRTREAILAVRQQTGSSVVTTQQVLTWLLDDEDRRTNGNTGTRSPTSTFSSVPSSVINTSAPSSIIYTGSNMASSLVYTGTSIGTSIVNATSSISTATFIANAGTTTSTVSSTSSAPTASIQQTGTPTSTSAISTLGTGNQQTEANGTGTMTGEASNSSSSSGGSPVENQSESSTAEVRQTGSVEKPSTSSGNNSESKTTATGDTVNNESPSKTSKKKRSKQKAKNKAGKGSGESGATGGGPETESLKAENEKLREMQTCKICMERPVNTTLLPCGHLVCCASCASRLQRCPICRKRIKGTVKTFMS